MAKKRYTEEERTKLMEELRVKLKTAPKKDRGKILARLGGLSGGGSLARRVVSIKAVNKYWNSPAGKKRKKAAAKKRS